MKEMRRKMGGCKKKMKFIDFGRKDEAGKSLLVFQ